MTAQSKANAGRSRAKVSKQPPIRRRHQRLPRLLRALEAPDLVAFSPVGKSRDSGRFPHEYGLLIKGNLRVVVQDAHAGCSAQEPHPRHALEGSNRHQKVAEVCAVRDFCVWHRESGYECRSRRGGVGSGVAATIRGWVVRLGDNQLRGGVMRGGKGGGGTRQGAFG